MNETDNKIIIFGCGGHSRSVADVLLSINPRLSLTFVDKNACDGERIYGFDVFKEFPVRDEYFFLAIGDNELRKKKFAEMGEKNLVSVISSRAYRSRLSTIGVGCFVGNFCHIGPDAIIGKNTILNTASIIEHEVIVGAHSHVGPNATISGRSSIGELVFVGVGATVKDHVSICSDVIIGAGTIVVEDIIEPGTYVGCPARKIR